MSSLPLTALWTDAGPLNAQRVRYLTSDDAVHLIEFKRNPPPLVVADCGKPLRWIPWSDYWEFWRREAIPRLADREGVAGIGVWEDYWYVASEWSTSGGSVISLEIAWRETLQPASESYVPSRIDRATDARSSLSQSDREFCLDLYRCAVRRYQPIIEERTGVRLGEIRVKPISELHGDALSKMRGANKLFGLVINGGVDRRAPSIADAIVGGIPLTVAAVYRDNSIYVSFTLGTQMHEDGITQTVVHELAHRLWEKLAGRLPVFIWRRKRRIQELKLVGEGFAVYAERIWFRDSYPPWLRKKLASEHLDESNLYIRGLRVIEDVVERFGPQILMRIPAQWRKLIRPTKAMSIDTKGKIA